MREVVLTVVILSGLIWYVTADSPRQPRVHGCYGECYEKYLEVHGTLMEQMKAQAELDAADEFSAIRGLWGGCASCHGMEGQGGIGPALAGQEIADMLKAYRAGETRGAQSALMWSQAGQLTDQEIDLLSKFTLQL
jgi:cytochrome c553|tara:strand:+ start:2161 stop:2568 length:408 start_codon:yes stop_codon:yes gene_type:complete